MQLYVKSFFNKYAVYNLESVSVGNIKRKFLNAASLEICAADGEKIVTVQQKEESILLEKQGEVWGPYAFNYTNEDGEPAYSSLVRPPRVQQIEMDSQYGIITIVQHTNRTFHAYIQKKEVCTIIHMLKCKKEILVVSDRISLETIMTLFAVCLFMLHDDDISIV